MAIKTSSMFGNNNHLTISDSNLNKDYKKLAVKLHDMMLKNKF